MKTIALLLITLTLCHHALKAQDETSVIHYSKKYIDLNVRSLEKYTRRIERQQKHLLHKLKRKEQRLARQLKKHDSAAYERYRSQSLSYDSIGRLSKPDSAALAARASRRTHAVIDSLKGVQSFLQSKTGTLQEGAGLIPSDARLGDLQGQLSHQQYINGLIDQRSLSLKNIAGSASADLPAFRGIEKEVFYGKARMKVFKQMADEPSKAEEMALEYLQGTPGFDQAFKSSNPGNSMQNATSAADLEKMGFQTKQQVSELMQKQFGSSLDGIRQQMGSQVADWQEQAHSVTREIKNARQQLSAARSDIAATKHSIKGIRNGGKPSFKANPMRGLPFRKRIEKGYNFQTSRATSDGKRPAILELSATAGFRHTPRLSYGLGMAASIGLGRDWSHIRFSFEGVGVRSYAKYEMIYGIAAYAGYERLFKQVAFTTDKDNSTTLQPYDDHNTAGYSESILLGLSKSYKINSKWNGAIQVLYDIWWQEKGLNSPVVLRFATNTK